MDNIYIFKKEYTKYIQTLNQKMIHHYSKSTYNAKPEMTYMTRFMN